MSRVRRLVPLNGNNGPMSLSMLSLQMAKFCIHLHQKDEDNNVGDLHKQQWKTRTNTDASWRSHERGKYNHPKPTSRVHLTRCRRSSSSRCPAHLCPIRSGMTDNYLSYDTKQKHISNTHTHTMLRGPKQQAYGGLPKSIGIADEYIRRIGKYAGPVHNLYNRGRY